MADVIYLDFDDGVKRVMNNAKLYVRLLGKFRNETKLDELESALGAGDYEKAQGQAHTIKGVAANLSLTELNIQSLEIETQIKAKQVQPDQFGKLKAAFEATLIEVDKVVAANG